MSFVTNRGRCAIAAFTIVVALAGPTVTPNALASRDRSSLLGGEWKLGEHDDGRLTLILRYSIGGRSQGDWGRTIQVSDARGLRADAFLSPGPVTFEIVRDAGTFACRGSMAKHGGTGTFEFQPDAEFARVLEARGVGRPTAQQEIRLALSHVRVKLIDALEDGGYPKPDVETLVELGDHGVSIEYVTELTAAGYRLRTLPRLLEARNHGVTAEFARGLAAAGYPNLDYDRLLEARDHGVTPKYIDELAQVGYTRLTYEQVREARDHGVTRGFVVSLADAGFRDLPFDTVVRARDHGLNGRRARRARNALGPKAGIDDVIDWVDRGGR